MDVGDDSDVYQTIGTDDGTFYQACRDGIYRITSEGTGTKQELIYKGFPGVDPQIDMDGDGKAEKIVLEPSPETKPDTAPDEPLRYYRLRIGEDALDGYGYSMANTDPDFWFSGHTFPI